VITQSAPAAEVMSTSGNGATGIDDLVLRACTVKIDVSGAPEGSGFFISPGHVVTCFHVIESALSESDVTDAIKVMDVDQVSHTVEAVANKWRDEDIAVLRVSASDRHRCVLLIPGQRIGDRFVTFGYPGGHREGVARSLMGEGATGDDRLLSLAQGQVQGGISGSPLLNTRTGGVCGLLRLTRDTTQALGGYAIPIELLLEKSPEMGTLNRAYHDANPNEWFNLLPAEQKTALLKALPGTSPSARSCTFVVSVRGKKEGDWEVSATLYPGGKLPPKPAPVQLVRDKVARLFRDWAARGRHGRFDPGEDVRLLGSILFGAVLPGVIGRRFKRMLFSTDQVVELALHFDRVPADFMRMPWEYLHAADPDVMAEAYVAANDELTFVRALSPQPRRPELPPRKRLSALMVGVTPSASPGHSPVDEVLKEAKRLADELDEFDLHTLEMPTSTTLRQKVQEGAYDIVHYVGFGQYLGGTDQLALGGTPDYQYVPADMFASLLAVRRRPRVVVLQEIEGPTGVVPADFSVFAWRLLPRVTAGVGYQFPLPGWLNVVFNDAFYRKLATGESFQTAVQTARSALWTSDPQLELYAFVSPAAFIDRPGELMLTAASAGAAPRARAGVNAGRAPA
jgi:Trypsin-like peptidase domain/CHAT domain